MKPTFATENAITDAEDGNRVTSLLHDQRLESVITEDNSISNVHYDFSHRTEPNQNSILRQRKSADSMSKSNVTVRRSMEELYPQDPADAVDRPSVLKSVAGYIIVTEFCERLAYYGFAGSLVLFFQTQLNYSNAEADVQYSAWSGFCYVTPLIGGYIADTYIGRYKAILIFCSIYLLGLVLVVFGSIPGTVSPILFFPAIYIIAIGTGGIKPNVSTLGADQFDDRYSQDRREKESFFNWFYWSINLGSMISYTLVAYICQYGLPFLGGESWGFFVGYSIPAIMMGLAIAIFVMGTPKYKLAAPKGSVLATSMQILMEAYWRRRHVRLEDLEKAATDSQDARIHASQAEESAQRESLQVLDKAKKEFGGSFDAVQVEGVKLVTRLLPFLAVMVPYWGIYSQMSTAFQNQGCQMDLSIGGGGNIPVSALNCFDTLAILLLVPVFDGYLYPFFKRRGYDVSMLAKMQWGFFFAFLSMLAAAFVEIARLQYKAKAGNYYDAAARDNITPCQNIDDFNPYNYQKWYAGEDEDKPYNCRKVCDDMYYDSDSSKELLQLQCIDCDDIPQMSKVHVLWQIFQFTLIGTSEILASITSLEFFYSQAPTVMRSVTQSLNLFTSALGSFMVIPLLLLVNADADHEWVPENLDDGHLDYYFFLLAGLMLLTMLWFQRISHGYEYKTTAELSLLESHDSDSENNQTNSSGGSAHANAMQHLLAENSTHSTCSDYNYHHSNAISVSRTPAEYKPSEDIAIHRDAAVIEEVSNSPIPTPMSQQSTLGAMLMTDFRRNPDQQPSATQHDALNPVHQQIT